MKIGIIGANGKSGTAIAKEAAKRGHDVTAIVRDASKIDGSKFKILQKEIMALTTEDLENFDAVANAFGTWAPETISMHQTTLAHIADILKGKKTRFLVVGGAGSLYTDKEHKTKLYELPDFPAEIKPLAESMGKALEALRKRDDVMWTYHKPRCGFSARRP